MGNNILSKQSKLPGIGTSIFSIMSKMAEDFNAVNLSQGFPDFDCPEELKSLVNYYMKNGNNQYAPMPGVPALRQMISNKIEKLYNRRYSPGTEITITAGATQALFTAVSAIIRSGDEAIIFEPAYDSYAPAVLANGGIPVFVPLAEPDFSYDWDKVKNAVSRKTRLIIINSPHNPTGYVISMSDIRSLEEITRGTSIFVISDEVYEHIVFEGRHNSLAGSGELSKRTFIISSFGKTYHATGWKTGYCAAPEALMNEFRKFHQFVVFAVNTPVQLAYADFMKNEEHYMQLNEFYRKKRDLVLNNIKNSRFKFTGTKGTYFQLLDYSNISGMNDMDFSEYMTKEKGIAVIPLSPFYSKDNSKKLIRICFAKKDEVLTGAAKLLCNI